MNNNRKSKFDKQLLLTLLGIVFFLTGSCSKNSLPEQPELPVDETGNEWVIYEINPKLFEENNSFNAVADRLDELAELGINVLWLMPIYEEGVEKAFGSPYSVKDYKKVNSDYGTLEELKALVSRAHSRDMKVILDWVGNHTSWDNAWIQNKEWYTQDASGNIVSPPGMNWADVADLNYGNNAMRQEMIAAMKYWVSEANVDGYRCDYAEGVPSDFWQEAITELKKIKPDELLMLAEGGKSSLLTDGFDLVYGWDFAYRLQDVYSGKITLQNLYETHEREYQGVPEGKQRMRYTTNHDMAHQNSPVQVYNGEQGAMSAFVIAACLGGSPMIYSSQELGYPQSLTFFRQVAMDWDTNADYQQEYKRIMQVYTTSDALRSGELRTYQTGNTATFLRKSQKEEVLVMVNTTSQPAEAKVPIEYSLSEADDLVNNTTETLPAVITLEPYQYKIWKVK